MTGRENSCNVMLLAENACSELWEWLVFGYKETLKFYQGCIRITESVLINSMGAASHRPQQTSNRVTVEQPEITQQHCGGIKHVNVISTPLEEYNLWSIRD